MYMCSKQLIFVHSKIFKSDRIKRSYLTKMAAHHACRNADLNSILGAKTTNRYLFQIIDLEMESMGVH